jgi:hypothetical protein
LVVTATAFWLLADAELSALEIDCAAAIPSNEEPEFPPPPPPPPPSVTPTPPDP